MLFDFILFWRKVIADQVMESSTGNTLWKTMNSVGILGTLGAALGISIPALVKANDAQDHDHRHPRDVDNDVVYLRSKIYLVLNIVLKRMIL